MRVPGLKSRLMIDSVFSCLAHLEDATYQLYEVLFDKAKNTRVRLLLGKIMLETRNHREILEQMSEDYGYTSGAALDCGNRMGTLYAVALASAGTLKEKVLEGMPILDAMKALVQYEDQVGEEYVIQAHAQLEAAGVVDVVAKRLLEDIAADEKVHADDLRLAIDIESKPLGQCGVEHVSSSGVTEVKLR